VHYRVSAFDDEGYRLFTVDLNPEENVLSLYFGDLDGDGDEEMFAVSWLEPSLFLHVFASDGSEVPGYPIILDTFASGWLPFGPPIPVDLDTDNDLEIVFGHWDSAGSRALCAHHDGTPCVDFPIEIATSSQLFYLGLGDLTGDGEPELIAFDNHLGGDYRLHTFDIATGLSLPGWPYDLLDWPKGFPTVADVDNDGLQDICLATDGGELHAVAVNGELIAGYPKQMVSPSISGVAAGDIDGDGFFELVAATWDGWVYAWETTGEVLPGRADWPMRGINARNTGVFGHSDLATAIHDGHHVRQNRFRVEPNPVVSRANFVVDPVSGPVTVEIFDPSGRRVETVSSADGHRLVWRPGPPAASGIYMARLRVSDSEMVTRFVLLR
jgi:hypothetical protein